MRIIKQEAFQPISILLETQEDVDKMRAIFNYHPLTKALKLGPIWNQFESCGGDYEKWFQEIVKTFTGAS